MSREAKRGNAVPPGANFRLLGLALCGLGPYEALMRSGGPCEAAPVLFAALEFPIEMDVCAPEAGGDGGGVCGLRQERPLAHPQ